VSKKEDLVEKIKKMNIEECTQYYSTAKSTNTAIHLIGIIIFFFILSMPTFIIIVCGLLGTTFLAKLSTGIDATIERLEERILSIDPDGL
jgi:predicted membrane channel-forming protein YqfA (hemolysin III family)